MVSIGARRNRYVDGRAGWRLFLFSAALSVITGLAFRLYFNPSRVQTWVKAAIVEQEPSADIRFQKAALRLARGAIPFLAIEISGVEVSLAPDCDIEPGLKIQKLWIPISFTSFFTGRVTIGTIEGENVVADVDALKARCSQSAAQEESSTPSFSPAPAQETAESSQPARWWTPEEMAEIQKLVKGVRLTNVEILFEQKTKKVYVGDFRVKPGQDDGFYLESELSIPPELVFGERLPLLRIEAQARPDSADVRVNANLNEGELTATGTLRPTRDGGLDAKIVASVKNVPLSTLAPLAVRSGIVHGTFQPRFMWMNCRAEISGQFQGLFDSNPLYLENCEIFGGGDSRIKVAKATRFPDGTWDHVRFEISRVELQRILTTFGWQGAESIFDDYGQLFGEIEIPEKGEGKFEGTIKNAVIRFSSRSQLAYQRLKQMGVKIQMKGGRIEGVLDGFEFDGGKADGTIEFTLMDDLRRGQASATIRSLRFVESVQTLLFGGPLEDANGSAEAVFRDGRLAEMKSVLRLIHLEGRDFRFKEAVAQTEFEPSTEEFRLHFQTPEFRISKNSNLAYAARPLFFGHEFNEEWVPVHDLVMRARFMRSGGLSWDLLQGQLEGGLIRINSVGQFTRDRKLTGWVSLDYPAVKNLRWRLAGQLGMPNFIDDSDALAELRRMPVVNDKVLGLPERSKNDDVVVEKTAL